MNWTPEAVHAELEYRAEQAMGDRGTTLEHLRGARAGNPSWWQRMRTRHSARHNARHGADHGVRHGAPKHAA